MLDTLRYSKKLIQGGLPVAQAEAQAEALSEVIDQTLATKDDLHVLEASMTRHFNELELRLENKLLLKVGSMIGLATALLAFMMSFHHY